MKRQYLAMLFPMTIAIASAFGEGCASKADDTPSGRICTPGAYVYCRCKDFSDGTKLCSDDGKSFGECGPCLGDGDTSPPPTDTEPPPTDTEPPPTDTGPGASDTCPGKTVAVDATSDVNITEDTSTANGDYVGETGACAVATSKEHVYAVIPTGSGKLTIKMTGTGSMDPTLYVRDTDCASGKQLACGETTGAGGTETVSINVTTGKTYWVFADGKAGSEGGYTLNMHLATGSFCGDSKVDTGEACDDGNKTPLDGCSNDCQKPEGDPALAGPCPGLPVHLWPGKILNWGGTTAIYPLSSESTLCAAGKNAPDRVYAVTAHKTGTMEVELNSTYNGVIYVKSGSCTTGTEIKCANAVGGTAGGIETMSFPVTDGSTYYVFVDGALTYKGTFTLTLSYL